MAFLDEDIFAFLKDLGHDQNQDPLERDFEAISKLHKKEEIKKNVEYRVPPHKDKRSLQVRYETLSMKRMKGILKQAKEDKRPKTSGSTRNLRSELEAELKELKDAVDKGQDTLELHTRKENKTSLGSRPLPVGLTFDEISSQPASGKASTEGSEEQPGWDMEYYLDNLDTDSLHDVGYAASPYRRSTKQLKEMSKRRQSETHTISRPQSAHATSKSLDFTREGINFDSEGSGYDRTSPMGFGTVARSYQDMHGIAGHAKHMAPSPVRNPSARYLVQQREKKEAADRNLYEMVLQEARLMQQKFTNCVVEANYFSRMLAKGDVYKVTEREPTEEAQWSSLLSLKGQPHKSSSIPRGSGQRIAKAQVEVYNDGKDVRYLGTDHFFREHGRLQHEFQRFRSVHPADDDEDTGGAAVMTALSRKYGYDDHSNPNNNAPGVPKSERSSPSNRNRLHREQSPRVSQIKARMIAAQNAETEEEEKKDISHGAVRQEIMQRLNDLLQIQVRKTFSLKHQAQTIRDEGWNLFV